MKDKPPSYTPFQVALDTPATTLQAFTLYYIGDHIKVRPLLHIAVWVQLEAARIVFILRKIRGPLAKPDSAVICPRRDGGWLKNPAIVGD